MTLKKRKRKRLTGPERRAQIVDVATALLAKKGFKGTTTREIARKAGISEAVIFKHFSRKEDLYRAIIDLRCDDGLGRSRLKSVVEGKSGREFFSEVAAFLINEHARDPTLMRLLTLSALEKQDMSEVFLKTRGLEFIEFIEDEIKGQIKKGLFRKVDARIAARAFLGMVFHYSMSQEIYGMKRYFSFSTKKVVETFVDIFFEGVIRR
ncbi:MAG: TetR/AcrR family transcriptional regulator [Thermodesulfobacteriota bacterium]